MDQPRRMTEAAATWRVPPVPVLLVAVGLIAGAEVGGGSMVQFKLGLTRWARGVMLARPDTHGLVGVRDVDEQILDEALVKFEHSGGLEDREAEVSIRMRRPPVRAGDLGMA